jgi:beta-lactamase class A
MTILLTSAFLAATLTQQAPAGSSSLEASLRDAIRSSSGAEVAVVYRTLDGRGEVLIDPDKSFHAASTMKVPVMIELFRQASAGTLRLDDPHPIRNEFKSIVDGSAYKLSEGADSDKAIYAAVGKTLTLRQLCEAMITVSSNFATNLLIEKLGVENVRQTVTRLGADGMQVLRGVEDQKAFDKGMNNTTTARGLLVLLEKLALGKAVNPKADAEMVEVLKRQKFNDAIPAGLPAGTPVAHKTGSITRIQHDAGVVYAERPYTVVLLVGGIQDEKESKALIAKLSKIIYERGGQVLTPYRARSARRSVMWLKTFVSRSGASNGSTGMVQPVNGRSARSSSAFRQSKASSSRPRTA